MIWPVGVGAKGSSVLVKQLKEIPFSIGYAEIAYALENDLAAAALQNASGEFVKPATLSTLTAAAQVMKKLDGNEQAAESDYRLSLVYVGVIL